MRIFQPDESEAEMCGNGIRCLAKSAFDAGYVKDSCTVETPAGSIGVAMDTAEDGFSATVTMTPPQFDRKDIPATGTGEYKEHIGDYDVYAVNTGVPHAVIIVDAVDAIDVAAVAPAIRHHAELPEGRERELRGEDRREQHPDPHLRAGRGGRDALVRYRCDRIGSGHAPGSGSPGMSSRSRPGAAPSRST